MSVYAKFIAAASAAVAVGVSVTADGSVSLNDGFAMLSAALGALAVLLTPNTPKES